LANRSSVTQRAGDATATQDHDGRFALRLRVAQSSLDVPAASADHRTIPGALERVAELHSRREAIVDAGLRLSFGELLDTVRGAASAIISMGFAPGDAAAVWAPNSVEWAVASLAVLFAGGSVVPVNTRYTSTEARDIFVRSRARLVFVQPEFLGRKFDAETSAMGIDAEVIALDDAFIGQSVTHDVAAELEPRLRAIAPHDISHIQFTSGTTGRPKGAMLRHDPMVQTTADWVRLVGVRVGDRYPVVSPLSHIGGHKTGLLAALVAGATSYPFATLDLDRLTDLVEAEGATVLQGPPTMFHALNARARTEPHRLSSLRVGVTGGSVIPPTLVRAMIEVLGLESVVTAYGLTETTGICTITRPGDAVETIAETSGRPIASVEVKITDPENPTNAALVSGEQGEILVRGFNVMAGYLDDPRATEEVMSDGWLRTGDIGWIGEDGNLRIVDRLKDMLIVGGFNAYPAEIEQAMLEHAGVAQVAVVGVADARLGEVPAAFVVTVPDCSLAPEEMVAFCKGRLANFKVPRFVWFVDSLPVNSSGKVQKSELRALAASYH
jgi:acyl-CoA synthetase (AMP-forming)/AMP-acid ligase II